MFTIDTLESLVQNRYDGKLKIIGGNDPYDLTGWSDNVDILPGVTYIAIVNYLLHTKSPYTADDIKSYKGLDAYYNMCLWLGERENCDCI